MMTFGLEWKNRDEGQLSRGSYLPTRVPCIPRTVNVKHNILPITLRVDPIFLQSFDNTPPPSLRVSLTLWPLSFPHVWLRGRFLYISFSSKLPGVSFLLWLAMIFDSVRPGSPVPESFRPGKNGIAGGEDETMKDICRKRREIRRVKLRGRTKPARDTVISPDCDVGFRNKRWKCADTGSEEPILIPEALVDEAAHNDVASGGASTLSGGFTGHTHGSVSVIGLRRAMEDAVAVELGFLTRGAKTYDFFGVYDGHGGFRVAQSCREMLHKLVAKIVEGGGGEEIDWGKVMEAGFREMDEEVNKNGAAVAMMGSTAVVAVVGEEEVVVAHCGDSRAVISRGGVAVQLSDDHKPDRPDELERIVGCGGKVIDWNGQRVLGVLATSRSIGDRCLNPFVTPEPEVKVVNITDLDEFLILASDGLWDVVSNDLACQVVRKCLHGRIKRTSHVSVVPQDIELEQVDKAKGENHVVIAANELVELALARGSRDNVSVIVVDLRHSKSGQVHSFSGSTSQVSSE